jgi:hypothetical protein
MGLFSPTFFVLLFQMITGYGLPLNFGLVHSSKGEYFWIFATLLELFCVLIYLLLMRTEYIAYFCEKRDRNITREKLLAEQRKLRETPGNTPSSLGRFDVTKRFTRDTDDAPPLELMGIVKLIWPAMVAIFLSICASVTTVCPQTFKCS